MPASPRPFSLKMFLPDGTADGLRVLTKTGWIGSALDCPRASLPDVKGREEFGRPGVYILLGPDDEGDLPTIYIGQGDVVRPRLEAHFKEKDFWTRVVFFTASDGSLTTAHVRYLESRLVALAREAKRAKLDNGNIPGEPALSESDRADADSFLADLLSILPLVGVDAFEKPRRRPRSHRATLQLKGRGVTAKGEDTPGGFVVLKGSMASFSEVPSIHGYLEAARHDLVDQGVLVTASNGKAYRFAQDYVFSSPSTAAGVVLGRSSNGRVEWKDAQGRTLKSLQEAAVPASSL